MVQKASRTSLNSIDRWYCSFINSYRSRAAARSHSPFHAATMPLHDKMLRRRDGWIKRKIANYKRVTSGVAGRAKTSQRGALKTSQCCDASYTSSDRFLASFALVISFCLRHFDRQEPAGPTGTSPGSWASTGRRSVGTFVSRRKAIQNQPARPPARRRLSPARPFRVLICSRSRRVKAACFGDVKNLDEFDFSFNTSDQTRKR